ncbi:nitrite reductase [Teratosphaeria nubilosa]|uniref:Nitrite reductase [NAD(P)H] n=1 Tax=Teratosphaeria nubilosa TaxID=161662 RepID=A0A6G1L6M8_9PEZI|nr:nitrite reductase [Teratosphaeria nubilosa]
MAVWSGAESNSKWNDPEANVLPEKVEKLEQNGEIPQSTNRKRIVVVGLGMVGISFIEKLMKLDVKRREYDVIVIGEEPHLAYNRVGLTSFFQHREVENLYLNPASWYASMPAGSLNYHLNTLVTEINSEKKTVQTAKGDIVPYDILVLATGSNALLPRHTPGYDAKGVFVYRTIDDLQQLIQFSKAKKGTTGAVVGGGLLGLEAAKAMMDLEKFEKVKLIERNRWVLSRQLDGDAGTMVVEQVRGLGLDVLLSKRVGKINTDEGNNVTGVTLEDGESMDCTCICFAIGIKARDELARKSGIKCADRGGGIIVNADLSTSIPDIYAIGECASWENQTFGLIAPGIEMADVLAFNLTQAKAHAPRKFKSPDLSTKLKLLGVEVASFGDFFADRDGPKELPAKRGEGNKEGTIEAKDRVKGLTEGPPPSPVKALTYKDPFQQVYKKYLFTMDGKYLLGGMMIGDTKDYVKLVPMVKNKKALEVPPSEFIVGASKGEENGDDLEDDTQICSCHNVLKGDVVKGVKDDTCKSIGDVKSCTKAGTGCGGCMPLVQTIFNKTMASMGQEVKNHLCPHFEYSRADLFNIINVKKIQSFEEVMKQAGKDANSVGCEACKPTIGSIIASLFNKHILDRDRRGLQETNDRFLANIQRNGTFSVVPRVSGGEITADKLIVIGTVAKKYGLYCKITGGQRIDLFGAKKNDLPDIWRELIDGGMESGHAYAKSLRTVKSCVGTTWCRYGIGDSVGMAVRLEERYKSIRSPHKIKGGVSGCVRECAEAQNKDFGLIATEKGFNIFVGGNGGAKPRHSELLAKDVPPDDVVPILDRYLSFYIRTADKLQRTARWIENLPGGIKYLQEVILQDKLGIAADLEKQMEDLVGTFFCEWTEVLQDPERMKLFKQFGNTDEYVENVDKVEDREQQRPAYWPKESVKEDFRGTKWTELSWQPLANTDQFEDTPTGSSLAVKRGDTQLAIFKVKGQYYASQQMCPHKRAFVLSDGLIGDDYKTDKLWVSCPYHKRNYELKGADAGKCGNDSEVNIATFPVEAREDGLVYVKLPPVEELDAVLGTEKWKVKKEETEKVGPFEALDRKLDAMKLKGRKGHAASHLPNGRGDKGRADFILAGELYMDIIYSLGHIAFSFSPESRHAGRAVSGGQCSIDVIVGVPGAFTPPCSSQVPGYVEHADKFAAKGVTGIYIVAVNDAFTTQAWKKHLNANHQIVHFLADDTGAFSREAGLSFDASGLLGNHRSQRYAAIVKNGTVEHIFVEDEAPSVTVTKADAVLQHLQ